ncbi:MAG TPA: YceD family protein [Actinomycetota bacterium]|nr:YceD family protein [Actinomycetota bacterium]
MTISVAEILGQPGSYRDLNISAPLDGVKTALARLDPQLIDARLRAESVVEGVLVTGRAQAATKLTCARCVTEFASPIEVEVCELFAGAGHEPAATEDFYEIRGTDIDIEPMLRDVVTLALPLNPHCEKDCSGLCANCGRVIGDGLCTCTEEERDPRWAGLDALKDKLSS